MAAKLCLVFIAVVVFCQMISWGVARPDGEPVKDAVADTKVALDKAMDTVKTSFDELLANLQVIATNQGNELLQNLTNTIKTFGEAVQTQGQELIQKVQTPTKTE